MRRVRLDDAAPEGRQVGWQRHVQERRRVDRRSDHAHQEPAQRTRRDHAVLDDAGRRQRGQTDPRRRHQVHDH